MRFFCICFARTPGSVCRMAAVSRSVWVSASSTFFVFSRASANWLFLGASGASYAHLTAPIPSVSMRMRFCGTRGALTKIVALSKLNNKEITTELAEEALKDLISPNAEKEVTPELIIQVVADHFGITPLDISSQKRNKEIVFPRQIVMYICRSMLGTSLQNIGKYLGGRDHTTIIHGHDKIAADMEKNESLRNTVEILMKKISPQ